MSKKGTTKSSKVNLLILILLVFSVILNLGLVYEMNFREYQKDTRLALAAAENWANNYCTLSKNFSDEMIEDNVKLMPPLQNALIEDYEGKKTLYVSYMDKSRFTQNWADSRFWVEECK